MQSHWILLSILGLAASSPVDVTKTGEGLLSKDVNTRNSALENLILGLLEDLRETMLVGSEDVPVLDPLEIDELHLDDEILPIPGANIKMNGLKVSKLSTFVVESLDVNSASIILQRYRMEFDFYVPILEIDAAYYDLAVSVAGISIFGSGDAKMNIIEPRLKGSLVIAPRISISGVYLSIISSEVRFAMKKLDSHFNGLLDDDSMSDFLNTFLEYFVQNLVQDFEDDITKFLSETVQEMGNELLADFNLAGILG